jgi:hypothetical protein
MKWLLIVVGVLVLIVAGMAATGAMLPRNHVASRTAQLSASPESLWSIVTDVSNYPAWRSEVDSVERLATPGLSWREVSGGDRITFEAVTMDAPSHFVAHIADKGLPFGGTWDYRIEPSGTGSRITITENGEVYNPIFRFVSKYFMGHTATIDKYLTALSRRTGDSNEADRR